jgi:hypothetical protein
MESYWLVLMLSCEKFRTFNLFRGFWLEIDRNSMMADLLSQIEGVRFFSVKVSYFIAFSQS